MGLEYLQAQETVLRALCREAKYIRKTNIAGRTEDYNYDFKYEENWTNVKIEANKEFRITRKNREWKKSEKQREKKRESSRIFCKCLLADLHYNYLYLYTELTITT